jgi:hypothetical protein
MCEASPKLSISISSMAAESYMLSKKTSLAALHSTSDHPPVREDMSLAQRLFGTKSCSVNLRNLILQSSSDHFLVPRPNAQIPPGEEGQSDILEGLKEVYHHVTYTTSNHEVEQGRYVNSLA